VRVRKYTDPERDPIILYTLMLKPGLVTHQSNADDVALVLTR